MPESARWIEQQLPLVVADGRAHRHLGRDVAGDALADGVHPLLDQAAGVVGIVARAVGLDPDVGRHLEDLLEALALVEALGEPQTRAGDAREGLAPAQQGLEGDRRFHGRSTLRAVHGR